MGVSYQDVVSKFDVLIIKYIQFLVFISQGCNPESIDSEEITKMHIEKCLLYISPRTRRNP